MAIAAFAAHFRPEATRGDGNCQFHALLRQLVRALDGGLLGAPAHFPEDAAVLRWQLAAVAGPDDAAAADDQAAPFRDLDDFRHRSGLLEFGDFGTSWGLSSLVHRLVPGMGLVVLSDGGRGLAVQAWPRAGAVRFVALLRLASNHYTSVEWRHSASGLLATGADLHRLRGIMGLAENELPLVVDQNARVDARFPARGATPPPEPAWTVRWDRWAGEDAERALVPLDAGAPRLWRVAPACAWVVRLALGDGVPLRFRPDPSGQGRLERALLADPDARVRAGPRVARDLGAPADALERDGFPATPRAVCGLCALAALVVLLVHADDGAWRLCGADAEPLPAADREGVLRRLRLTPPDAVAVDFGPAWMPDAAGQTASRWDVLGNEEQVAANNGPVRVVEAA